MTIDELQKLRNINIKKSLNSIMSAFRGTHWLSIYAAAYIIAKTEGKKTKDFNSFLDEYHIKAQLSPALFNTVGEKWSIINDLSDTCSSDECKAILLFDDTIPKVNHFGETPTGVSILSAKLLNITSEKRGVDLCAGLLAFIRECVSLGIDCEYLGSETNTDIRNVAMMKADILGSNITVTSEDSLKIIGKYDFIFCHSELGLKWKDYYPECSHSVSADWLFAEKCIELINDTGKAVCVMTNGSMRNLCDRNMRKKFISSGYIETIIALPANIYSNTAISSTLMVLSKGNKTVNFIDATDQFSPSRRTNQLSEKDILSILKAVGKSSTISCTISNEEIAAKDYELYPQKYTEKEPEIVNAVTFSELISRITRGAQIKASELDNLVCEDETAIKLLMLSDMSKGIISESLPFLSELDKRYKKYCANEGDIILSKNGYPVKTAVIAISGNEKILVNGNLYIIELDRTKADPYYIKAYFDSEKGQALLKSICVGVTIPNIPIEALKKLQIPMCPITEQKKIADKYRQKQLELIKLQKQIEVVEQDLKNFF